MIESLETHTEKAFALLGGKLPHIAYLPPELRTRPMPADVSDEDLSEVQLDQIVAANPLGFLIALMNGQPVVTFGIDEAESDPSAERKRGRPKKVTATARMKVSEENGHSVYAEFHSPSLADRQRIAMYFADKLVGRRASKTPEAPKWVDERHERMIAEALAQAEEYKRAQASANADDPEPQ